MQKRPNSWHSKLTLAGAGIAAFAMLLGALQLRANECQKRTEKAAHHLHDAVVHHGDHSPQADRARHELNDAREYCWDHGHRWWDSDSQQWHSNHGWDNGQSDHDSH